MELLGAVGLAIAFTLLAMRLLAPAPSAVMAGRAISDELAPYLARYGPPQYSSHEEELFVRDFFRDRRDGVFVDVGAGHYRDRNNTYYLERHLGWSGIAVDAQAKFAADYAKHRPRTRFYTFFVADRSDERARLFVGRSDLFSSSNEGFTASATGVAAESTVPTITLDDLLTRTGLTRVDFLSVDVELAEPKVLGGFDLARVPPALVCIEAHPPVRQAILDYFARRGYTVVGRYLRADPQNLWFRPPPEG